MSKVNPIERLQNTKRNDPCPCGSGKKYKKCHMDEDQKLKSEEITSLAEKADKDHSKKADKTDTPKKGAKDDHHKKKSQKPSTISDSAVNKGKLRNRKKV